MGRDLAPAHILGGGTIDYWVSPSDSTQYSLPEREHLVPSIIIPAHNEAAVLAESLHYLFQGLPHQVEVVVVCNACTDDSAAIARRFPRVKLIESPIPSKTNALNLGEEVVPSP